ncbi:glycoside hydrolase family 81 protein [Trematosphaeria pertusa]|uniref:glucan endo-1,3-beta-D-glucosidase n=1 Tax=Trematosphaeria pertusa TaxID=390896 RepID=A0A6A6I009_9PLEO|nr:glycoside hydrolase family 81 protein [Trematosphaeria pertusa]KAF2243824.1 glycoside hydrolase family 81 protein [Trematosphaeria pertusa]
MGKPHSTLQPPSSKNSSRLALYQTLNNTFASIQSPPSTTATNPIPADNIFVPIQQDNILPQIPIGNHHPVPRKGIEDNDTRTLHTNKFYANAFLGEQNQPVWTHPYSIWWGKGGKELGYFPTWGMNVAFVHAADVVFGEGDPARTYINPKKQSIILSAQEFDQDTILTTDTILPFSVNINLKRGRAVDSPRMTFPAVQGMSFVTARYRNATPMIHTAPNGFTEVSFPITIGKSMKYRVKDTDGRNWVIYVNPIPNLSHDVWRFTKVSNNTLIGRSGFRGTIQVAKNPLGSEGESLYDKAFGTYVTEAQLVATVNETRGSYSLNYKKSGGAPLLMFALPHHIQSLDPELKNHVTRLKLRTTTKGIATAVWGDRLTFIEPNLPTSMGFAPWTPTLGASKIRYPPDTLAFLTAVAERDLRRAMTDDIPQDSLYAAGKSLAKFATIVWVLKELLNNPVLAHTGLGKLQAEMARYIANRQRHALYYDDAWKGLVSCAGFPADPAADGANTYYTDHHIHYAYFVYVAAVIGYLDADWLAQGDNRAWTNMLVKDFAESAYAGRDYPFSRCFDWWHGHSWATGLFESADGKDAERSGEDGWASFAVKMWGRVSGDGDMEKRAIQARACNAYFYLLPTNTNHPPRFISNSVTGRLFENKVDYATPLTTVPTSPLPIHIHAAHMHPISPATAYLRPRAFVRAEWDRHFSSSNSALVDASLPDDSGGWRGILYANLALADAKASYSFFRNGVAGVWDERWVDGGGASRTWYLAWAGAFVGGR